MVGFHDDSIISQESNRNEARKTSKNYNLRLDLNDFKVSNDSSTTSKKYKSYQCGNCRKIFNKKNYYQNHLRSHGNANTNPYSCNICGKSFSVPARLTRHFRTHTGEKPYQCEYCNKSFSVKENLSVHRRIHTKERPYKCNVCESAFEHSGKLHRHMRIHTGERPHKCSICNKTFIQSGQLVIHMRTHTGEKPYICKSCGKGFTCSKQLKVHTRTHTGEKPYKCEICDKSFGYNHVLKLHQVAHYGEKFYKCTICHETFNSKKSMEFHIRTHSDSSINNIKSSDIIFEKSQNINKFYDNEIPKNNSKTENIDKTSNNRKLLKKIAETTENEYPKAVIYLNSKFNRETKSTDELLSIHSFSPKKSENSFLEIQTCHNIEIKNEISSHQYFFTDLHSNNNRTEKIKGKDIHKQYSLICDTQQNINRDTEALEITDKQSYKLERHNVVSDMYQNTLSSEIPDKTVQPSLHIKDNVCLPPRKRSKMILESMEIEQSNLTINKRLNSVIRFARTKQI